jgi:hypothetical protein
MRRRTPEGEVPARLESFTPSDWPGRTWHDRYELWNEARRTWNDEHGWPGGPLALLRDASDLRRRHEGAPLLSWGRTPRELDALNGEMTENPRRLA